MLSPVSFDLGGVPVQVDNWQLSDSQGGYDQCSGFLSEQDYRVAGSPTQGAALAAYDHAYGVIWAGRLAAPPQLKDGRAIFNAVGYKEAAAKKTQRLLIQSADLSQWVQYDSDPHLNGSDVPVYDHHRKINMDATNTGLRWSLNANQGFNSTDAAVYIFYAEGVDLGGGRLRWTGTWNSADDFAKLDLRVQKADGPTGAESNVTTVTMGSGNRDTAQNVSIGGSSSNDLITLGLHCNDITFSPNANAMRWMATKVRVNSSITSGDSYNAYEVVTYIAGQMGWTTLGVTATTFDVLPFDWIDGSWLDAMLYVAELEDKFVRVGNGSVEYGSWGTTNWKVTQASGADPDLKPLELFNRARVSYETASGVKRTKTRTTSDVSITDPLSASGITNTFEYELEDRQKNGTLASAVADKLVTRYSQQRYSGSIEVVKATTDDGRSNPRAIRYGDTITVQDWGPGAAQTLRVVEVTQGRSSVTLGVEQPINIADLISATTKRGRGGRVGQRG